VTSDAHFMSQALAQAREAELAGEVPVGAVVVKDGEIIAAARNRTREWNDPTAHAEVIALREAAQRVGNHRLDGVELFVTLEPCPMCSGAIFHSRLSRVVFGAYDPKTGCAGSVLDLFASRQLNHHTQVIGGVMADECAGLLQAFFQASRAQQAAQAEPLRQDAVRSDASDFAGFQALIQLGSFAFNREGLRLHYVDSALPGTGKTVLCLHDLPYWSHQFLPLLGPLRDAGFRVLIPDLLGCGLSDKPKKKSWHSASAHAQSVLDICSGLNVVPSHVVAIGAGGAIAQVLLGLADWKAPLISVQRAAMPQARRRQASGAGLDLLNVNTSVWNGKRKDHLTGLSAETQKALAVPFADAGFAAVLDGLSDSSFAQRPPATLLVDSELTMELDTPLCERLMAELLRR